MIDANKNKSSKLIIEYVLPLRWSLHFALTEKQWRGLRERYKRIYPDWEKCSCPKHCKANTLDEKWIYEYATHTKIFNGIKFICPGCHWLKSPTWRIDTWLQKLIGILPVSTKSPHIIDCLGWTQQQIDTLYKNDLREHEEDMIKLTRIEKRVKKKKAAIIPTTIERLSSEELAVLVKPKQIVISPWRVNLSALSEYRYSSDEIAVFEERMYQLAAKRMSWDV